MVTGPRSRQVRRVQVPAGVGCQFAHPDLFGPVVWEIKILRAAFPTRRGDEPPPVSGLVSRALIEMRVHEGFRQSQRMPPVVLPIPGKPREYEFHTIIQSTSRQPLPTMEKCVLHDRGLRAGLSEEVSDENNIKPTTTILDALGL